MDDDINIFVVLVILFELVKDLCWEGNVFIYEGKIEIFLEELKK